VTLAMKVFNRLYLKVYVTVVVTLVLATAVSAAIWASGPDMATARGAFGMASGVAAAALADTDAPREQQQQAITRLSRLLDADVAVYDSDERLIGAAGATLPTPSEVDDGPEVLHSRNPVWKFSLRDGRIIVVRPPLSQHVHGAGFFLHVSVVALILAIGSFPVVRGLTRRLERLQLAVENFGSGDLSARVPVEGKDEVAKVAESFNRAASKIEELVTAHKMLLANTSHELRTPLTRLRLGVERIKDLADPQVRAGLEQDITDLDDLIEGVLLSSRLEAMKRLEVSEEVDLLALAAEEASRYEDIAVSGTPILVKGDPRLLRRLLRNLLDNATRHGKPPVEVEVLGAGGSASLSVKDHGPGVDAADAGRIFEPFFRKGAPSGSDKGAGLGLALVRQIARLHGGDARLEGGSAFVISLPKCGI
jgi:signal transduction histidine kinase